MTAYTQPKYAAFIPLSPASAEFCENIEILQKRANSAAWLKIRHLAENCTPY